jgi:hypothetical protein
VVLGIGVTVNIVYMTIAIYKNRIGDKYILLKSILYNKKSVRGLARYLLVILNT